MEVSDTLLATRKHLCSDPPLSLYASLAAANLMVAILIRQEYVINTLYKTLWLVPLSFPLSVSTASFHCPQHQALVSLLFLSIIISYLANPLSRRFESGLQRSTNLEEYTVAPQSVQPSGSSS